MEPCHKWRRLPVRDKIEKERLRQRREKFVRIETMHLEMEPGMCFPPKNLDKSLAVEERLLRHEQQVRFSNARGAKMKAREDHILLMREQEAEKEQRRIEAHKLQLRDKIDGSAWNIVTGALRDNEKAKRLINAMETQKLRSARRFASRMPQFDILTGEPKENIMATLLLEASNASQDMNVNKCLCN